MKVTYNWLKDFVEIKMPAELLASKLTMAGLEVTAFEARDGDFVFEIEITSNRPDWLSVIGIAREVAAITGKKLRVTKSQSHKVTKSQSRESLGIEIENKKDCPLYTAKIIRGVKVGPSPDWLKKRLELVGCRSINNVVDITNYVLFETGEPLHAFDLDKIGKGEIVIRRARNNEKITTIDGVERKLTPEILLIADKEKALAIAGIMGGKDTEVTERSQNILLEAAVFAPIVIRRGRQKLGLQTDSSYRFERGVDFQSAQNASLRALQLILESCAGKFVLAKSSAKTEAQKRSILLDNLSVEKILGIKIPAATTRCALNNLGFQLKTKSKDKFAVRAPAFRQDVDLEIDLIEEVARIFGYENIPTSLPAVKPRVSIGERRDLVSKVQDILQGLGLNEAITYSLMDQDLLPLFKLGRQLPAVEVLNPLSKEQGILRPTILPGLVTSLAYNLNQRQEYVNIFEIANIFRAEKDSPKEELVLAMALSGARSLSMERGIAKDESSLLHLKGILEVLFERLRIGDYDFTADSNPALINIMIGQEKAGVMSALPKNVLEKLDIKSEDVFVAEISLEKCFARAQLKKKFLPLPKYPGIIRDISFIIGEEIPLREVLDTIKEQGRPLLRQIKIADYYRGRQIPEGHRGLTLSCLYRSEERTLTEAEVNPLHNQVCNILRERLGVKIR